MFRTRPPKKWRGRKTRNRRNTNKKKSKPSAKKKRAAAIYEYQADCDGEWGEISFDFENGTAEIVRLADWDTIKTNWFANEAIRYTLSLSPDALKKYMLVPLEPPLIS